METKAFQAIPNHSPTTAKIVELLITKKPGDFVSDTEIAEACGCKVSVNEAGYSNLLTAIKRVCRLHGLDFQRVRGGGGIKCYTSGETASTLDTHYRRIGKEARRGLSRSATVKIEQLAVDKRTPYLAITSQLGALHHMATSTATKALEARQANTAPDLPKLLEAFAAATG